MRREGTQRRTARGAPWPIRDPIQTSISLSMLAYREQTNPMAIGTLV